MTAPRGVNQKNPPRNALRDNGDDGLRIGWPCAPHRGGAS